MGYNSSGGGGQEEVSKENRLQRPGLNRDPVEINSVSSMLLSPVVDCTQEVPEEAINLSSEGGRLGRREVIGTELLWGSSSRSWRNTEQSHPQVREIGTLASVAGDLCSPRLNTCPGCSVSFKPLL